MQKPTSSLKKKLKQIRCQAKPVLGVLAQMQMQSAPLRDVLRQSAPLRDALRQSAPLRDALRQSALRDGFTLNEAIKPTEPLTKPVKQVNSLTNAVKQIQPLTNAVKQADPLTPTLRQARKETGLTGTSFEQMRKQTARIFELERRMALPTLNAFEQTKNIFEQERRMAASTLSAFEQMRAHAAHVLEQERWMALPTLNAFAQTRNIFEQERRMAASTLSAFEQMRAHAAHVLEQERWMALPTLNAFAQTRNIFEQERRMAASTLSAFEQMQGPLANLFEQDRTIASPTLDSLPQFQVSNSSFRTFDDEAQRLMSPAQDTVRRFAAHQIHNDIFATIQALQSWGVDLRRAFETLRIKLRLLSQSWLVRDANVISEIRHEGDASSVALAKVVVKYYKENNWQKLEAMIRSWTNIHSSRLYIFDSVLKVVQNSSTRNAYAATIPTLIAQIDGLIRALYAAFPSGFKCRIRRQLLSSPSDCGSDAIDATAKRVDLRPEQVIQGIIELGEPFSAKIMKEKIYGGLFKSSNSIHVDDDHSLNRHKIMHGEIDFLDYGSEENFVRLMLYADFIINLIRIVKVGSHKLIDVEHTPWT